MGAKWRNREIFCRKMQRWSLGKSLLACWPIGTCGVSDTRPVSNIAFELTNDDDDDDDHDLKMFQ